MLTALLLATALTSADATEVGRDKTLGLGLTVGFPTALTGKYWLNEKVGVTGYLGSFWGQSIALRVQGDFEVAELADVGWSRIALYGVAGGQLYTARDVLGLGGVVGVGGVMQFHNVPAEVFVEPAVFIGTVTDSGLAFQPAGVAGGRWYF